VAVEAPAGAAELGSQHPLPDAIAKHARSRCPELPSPQSVRAIDGLGLEARVDGRSVLLGSAALLASRGVALGGLSARAERWKEQGASTVLVAVDGEARGLFAVRDEPKPSAKTAVAALHQRGVDVWMLTGDAPAVARAVAAQVGVPANRVVAALLPGGKADYVRRLQASGKVVGMVGDGINDAPALAQADVGIALGSGTDVAIAASDVTLVGTSVEGVASALVLSARAMRVIRQNLTWAFGYNVVLIPIAMGLLYPLLGIRLSPLWSAVAMSLSSVSVVLSSLRLRSDGWVGLIAAALGSLARLDGGYVLSTTPPRGRG
jgi:Cu+-exporting ATPase